MLILPALMLLMLVGIQVAVYGLASHAAALAAADGGAAARAASGNPSAGAHAAFQDVRAIAAGLLIQPHLTTSVANGEVTLRLKARVPVLFPGLHLSVLATSSGPTQQFRAAG